MGSGAVCVKCAKCRAGRMACRFGHIQDQSYGRRGPDGNRNKKLTLACKLEKGKISSGKEIGIAFGRWKWDLRGISIDAFVNASFHFKHLGKDN